MEEKWYTSVRKVEKFQPKQILGLDHPSWGSGERGRKRMGRNDSVKWVQNRKERRKKGTEEAEKKEEQNASSC